MLDQMLVYFAAEKAESLLFVGFGMTALLLGLGVLAVRERFSLFLQGFAYPLLAVAMIQVAVGANIYLRTDAQLAALQAQLEQAPDVFKAEETARMRVVNRNFDLYKRLEIGLLLIGVACAAFGAARNLGLLAGVGTGMVVQGGLMLVLDFFAEARADFYTAALLAL